MSKFKQFPIKNVTLIYPHLSKPDTAFGNEANPKFHTKFKLDGERAERLCAAIDNAMAEFEQTSAAKQAKVIPKRSNIPYERAEDGSVVFKSTVNKFGAFGKPSQWENKVPIVDAKLQPCSKPVYGGSEVNLMVELYTYPLNGAIGAQLRPKAVQVLKLAEQSSEDMSDSERVKAMGFEATDGFTDDSPEQGFNQPVDSEEEF